MSSDYTERYVRAGNETTWGTYASPSSFDALEYIMNFNATAEEVLIEEDLIAASRQARSRAFAQREVAGSFEENPLSPRWLYYALGSVSSDATSPYSTTISGSYYLPSFSIEEGMRGQSDTMYVGYMGCKVDRLEFLIEGEEDITFTVDWAGKDNTFPSYASWGTVAPSGAWTGDPVPYHKACLKWGSETINLYRIRGEINNNLEARFAGSCGSGVATATALREGSQLISGEFRIESNVQQYAETFARGRTEGTITISYGTDSLGTIEITLNKVAITEFPNDLSGRDAYEVDFPFTARASGPSNYDAISVTYESTAYGTIHDMPW